MKKFFLIIYLIFALQIPVFAEYKPIPKNLSKQYKKEIELIINTEYPQVIKNIDKNVKDAKNLRNKIIKNGFNIEDYINISLIAEVCIPATDLDLYSKLMEVTQEKYLKVKYKPIGTDNTNPLDEFLYPYMQDNNINREKLTKIVDYQNKQILIIEKYIHEVEKLRR